MASNGIKKHQVSATAPPRTLNVQKFAESRAAELEALHSIVSNRLKGDFRSQRNKRRRTTAYDNRVAKRRYRNRQKLGEVDVSEEKGNLERESKKKVPRYVRRKIELRGNPESGFCTSGDGTKRLRTHIWHAKRFTMKKIWGFYLPLGLHGSGRGSRSIMKSLRDGVIVHDASYTTAVELEGPELHHVGAPSSITIAPVTYMWRPSHQQSGDFDVVGHKNDVCHDILKIDNSSASRQVWVWIHAAAFREGYDVLESACQRESEKTGALVTCISLEGLGKLEVMGSKTSQLLQKILHPVTSFPENYWELKKCSAAEDDNETQLGNSSVFENDDQIFSSVISLTVNDPRLLTGKDDMFVPRARSTGMRGHEEDEDDGHKTSAGIAESSIELLSSRCLGNGESSVIFDSIDLWDASKGIGPPVEESVLCMEKHHQRLASYCLNDKGPRELYASTKGQCSRLCPILLLRNNNLKNSITRWSIVLPLSWVKTFWIPLVSGGACAIGLREKHWIACEVGLPYFPSDFPDCKAYSCFMETEAAASVQNAELRPSSVRPFTVPIPPPWDVVWYTYEKKSPDLIYNQNRPKMLSFESRISNYLTTNPHEDCHIPPCCTNGVLFEGSVPRTSYLLSQFVSGINDDHLLIFPNMPDRTKCISKIMKDKEIFNRGPKATISLLNYNHKLCFVRVLLHAYREGVFEEGAVVCAPHLSDLKFWTSRLDSVNIELQIPQTLVRSYFVQQPSGKWDLQVPDDPVARESHRWPIGFITTGFVHGSKKPVAGALCDAALLAHLREEQWNAVPMQRRRKEIYVLVRNLRSTAYRLALASIVLEQQEEDVEYM